MRSRGLYQLAKGALPPLQVKPVEDGKDHAFTLCRFTHNQRKSTKIPHCLELTATLDDLRERLEVRALIQGHETGLRQWRTPFPSQVSPVFLPRVRCPWGVEIGTVMFGGRDLADRALNSSSTGEGYSISLASLHEPANYLCGWIYHPAVQLV